MSADATAIIAALTELQNSACGLLAALIFAVTWRG